MQKYFKFEDAKKMKNDIIKFLLNLRYNLIYAFLLALVFILGEQIFRVNNPLLTFNLSLDKIAVQFLISFIALFMLNKTIRWIYSFILLFTFIQFVHFNYYGTWVFPLEYFLFFSKFRETMETFTSVLDITIIPIIIILIMTYLTFKIISKMSESRVKIPYLSFVLVLFLIFVPARVFFNDGSKKGARPNIEITPIVNTIETMGFFIGRILPQKFFGNSKLMKEVVETPILTVKAPDANIIVIMGESLTCKPMSLYGEEEKTTPNLDTFKDDKNFIYQTAFASGVMTDISIPSFFNMLYEPDSTQQIISTNTCLFKMAKENGFNTHFYSAQCSDGLSNIKSYLCTRWIDNYLDGSSETGEIKKDAWDNILLERLDKINFEESNFVVLHQIGSHSPVRWRYPKEFDKFKPNPKDEVDLSGYKNTILYTDYIISEMIKKLQKRSKKPTYIFFTSDHGEGIDNHSGHGHLHVKDQYEVPFIMYKINTNDDLDYKLKDKKYTSHYEISKLVATALGYNVSSLRQYDGNHVVTGKDLSGIAGYLKIKISNDKIKKLKIIN